jgi:transcriptional regulator with XRE-family HTH domain
MEFIHRKIKLRIAELGMSQVVLAQKMKVSTPHISKIINQKYNIGVAQLTNLCEALDVSPNYFFDLEDAMSAQEPTATYQTANSPALEAKDREIELLKEQIELYKKLVKK